MRNKKIILVAFILCAAMVIGVGYATLSTTLTIDGIAAIKTDGAMTEYDGDVTFQSATGGVTGVDAVTIPTGGKTATITVDSLKVAGDSVTFEFVVQSTSQFESTVSIKDIKVANTTTNPATAGLITTGESEWLDVTATWADDTIEAGSESTPSTVKLTVTIKLNKTPTEAINRTLQILIGAETTT